MSTAPDRKLVLVVEAAETFVLRVRDLLRNHRTLAAADLEEAREIVLGGRVDLVILGPSNATEHGVLAASSLREADPTIEMVLAADVVTNRLLKTALRTGLADVVETPVTAAGLADVIVTAEPSGPEVAVTLEDPTGASVAPEFAEPRTGPSQSWLPEETIETPSDRPWEPEPPIGEPPEIWEHAIEIAEYEAFDLTASDPIEPLVDAAAAGADSIEEAPDPGWLPAASEVFPDLETPGDGAISREPESSFDVERYRHEPSPLVDPDEAPAAAVDARAAVAQLLDDFAATRAGGSPFAEEEQPPAAGPGLADEPAPPPPPVPQVGAAMDEVGGMLPIPPPPADPPPTPFDTAVVGSAPEGRSFGPAQIATAPAAPRGGRGRVIAVMAGKGGSGKSVVATNLAVAIGMRTEPEQVAIVDADLQFGDVALMMQIDPVRTIDDLIGRLDLITDGQLHASLIPHESGVRVLPAPLLPVKPEEIPGKSVVAVIERLRSTFSTIVVDTGGMFDEHLIEILDHADSVIAVVDMDLPSVKNAKVALETMRARGFGMDKVVLVVNRVNSKARLDLGELERSLGLRVGGSVPSDRLVPQSVNEGIPLLALSPRSKVARSFLALAERFDPRSARDRMVRSPR